MATTVLVLGASGLLGRAVHKALLQEDSASIRVIGTGHARAASTGLAPLDVTDAEALRACLDRTRPAVVVNCVAERRPDRVEREEGRARRLNVDLARALAEASATQGFHLVHVSTDYVFDGRSPPYAPDAAPHPLNAYGRHKLESEEAIRNCPTLSATAWLILRVPVLYGESADVAESSITALVTDVLAQDQRKTVDDWAARFPTHTADVAEVVRRVVVTGAGGGGGFLSGVQHFSSKERDPEQGTRPYTKYAIVKIIGEIMGKSTDHLKPDPDPPAGGAARPKDCEWTNSSWWAS